MSAVKQSRWTFSPSSIIVGLCTLLGLGILGFVLFTIKSNGNLGPESTAVSTTMTTTTTTTSAGSTTMAINTTAYTLETTTEVTMSTAATTISSRQMNNYLKRKDKQLRAIVLLLGGKLICYWCLSLTLRFFQQIQIRLLLSS